MRCARIPTHQLDIITYYRRKMLQHNTTQGRGPQSSPNRPESAESARRFRPEKHETTELGTTDPRHETPGNRAESAHSWESRTPKTRGNQPSRPRPNQRSRPTREFRRTQPNDNSGNTNNIRHSDATRLECLCTPMNQTRPSTHVFPDSHPLPKHSHLPRTTLNFSWTEQMHNARSMFQDQHRCRNRADNQHYVNLKGCRCAMASLRQRVSSRRRVDSGPAWCRGRRVWRRRSSSRRPGRPSDVGPRRRDRRAGSARAGWAQG